MNKLSILIGIGFMLVGALAYTIPEEEGDVRHLVPAFSGFVIALVGLRGLRGEATSPEITFANMIGCFLLITYGVLRLMTDNILSAKGVELLCNLVVIAYSMLFIFKAKQSLAEI